MQRVENPRKLKTMIKCYINDDADISKACNYFLNMTNEKKAQFIKSSVECCGFEYHAYTYSKILKINEKLNIMSL